MRDPNSVKRSSDIFKRVIAELRGAMQRHGFRMIDEESVAVDLGWEITDRRPKSELIETIKLMSKSNQASHQVRAWVLFRIHAQAKELSFSTKVQTRIDGEIYDAASNQFLDTFEMPREEYPAPKDCLESSICISEVVGDRSREIAGGLGEVLARKLARYSPPRQSGGSGTAVTGGSGSGAGSTHTGAGHGMMTPYTVTLRYFEDREALTIVGVMADEFPGYETHDLINKSAHGAALQLPDHREGVQARGVALHPAAGHGLRRDERCAHPGPGHRGHGGQAHPDPGPPGVPGRDPALQLGGRGARRSAGAPFRAGTASWEAVPVAASRRDSLVITAALSVDQRA